MVELEGLQRTCALLDYVELVPALKASVFIGLQDTEGLQLKLSSEVAVSVTLPQKLGLDKPKAVDRRLLLPFVAHKGTYKGEIKDNMLFLRQGHRKAKIPLLDLDWTYGDWQLEKNKSTVVLSKELINKIECAGMCAADRTVLPELSGVYIEFGKQALVFAANDVVFCHGRAGYKSEIKSMVVPIPLVAPIVKEGVNTIFVKGQIVGFELEGARVWSQAPEKTWTDFPVERLKKLILTSRKETSNFTVKTSEFAAVCKQFSGYLGSCGAEGALSLQTTDKGRLKMKLNAGGFANFENTIKADIKQELAETEINLAIAEPVFSFLKDKEEDAQFTALESVHHIKSGDYEFLFSVRLK